MTLRKEERTLDDLQNGYWIYQYRDGFRFGADAVLLSDFARIRKEEEVVDLGTGSGILPILLCAKGKGGCFTGIELQEDYVELARESVRYNALEERIMILRADIRTVSAVLPKNRFDACVSNPPYLSAEDGKHSGDGARAMAKHETACTFSDVAASAFDLLKSSGRFFFVHRPNRLAEILHTLIEVRLEPKRLQFVHPRADRAPSLILIEAVKGARSGMTVDPPIILSPVPGEEKR